MPIWASVMISYGNNQVLQGCFGFQLEYKNHLDLWGYKFNFYLDRAFTIPPNFSNTINHKSGNKMNTILVPPCDAFYEMFNHFSKIYYERDNAIYYNKKCAVRNKHPPDNLTFLYISCAKNRNYYRDYNNHSYFFIK